MKNNVRSMRQERFMSQVNLANLSGVSRRTIVSIEGGKNCRGMNKWKLARVFFGAECTHQDVLQLFPIK